MFSVGFSLTEERDEIMDSVVNTCTAELQDMLYEVPGEPRSIKQRSHRMDLRDIRAMVSNEAMNKPGSPIKGKKKSTGEKIKHAFLRQDRYATGTTL